MARDQRPSPALSEGGHATPRQAATAGAVSVALALGVSEGLGGVLGQHGHSTLARVGEVVTRNTPAGLEDLVVGALGHLDKPFLVVVMVLTCMTAGALLAVADTRFPHASSCGWAAFASLGVMAALSSPQPRIGTAIAPPLCAALVGLTCLRGLMRLGASPPSPERRLFLRFSAAALALAAGFASAGRLLTSRGREIARAALPSPAHPAPPPSPAWQAPDAPPFTTPTDAFYRVDILLDPLAVSTQTWRLEVNGSVEHPLSLTYAELLTLPMTEADITLTCVSNPVGGDLVGNARWLGVPLVALLDRAGVRPDADFVVARSVDGFTVGFPLARLRDGRSALVAIGMNGDPLPPEHGFPARLVVAGLYGYIGGTKWLASIELGARAALEARVGARGRNTQHPIYTESRIDHPAPGARVPVGQVTISGVAWAQARGISRVEVRIDGGPWREALLAEVPGSDTWRQWWLAWEATSGPHRLEVRTTDATGEVQTAERRRPADGGATGWHAIDVEVG